MEKMKSGYETCMIKVRKYKPFVYGCSNLIDAMSELVAEGRTLITPKQLAIARLQLGKLKEKDEYLMNENIFVNVAVILSPGGEEIKYVINHPFTSMLNPSFREFTNLTDAKFSKEGNLIVSDREYYMCSGFTFSRSEINAFRKNSMALPKKRTELLEYLLEGDSKLRKKYEQYADHIAGLSHYNNGSLGVKIPCNFITSLDEPYFIEKGFNLLVMSSLNPIDSDYHTLETEISTLEIRPLTSYRDNGIVAGVAQNQVTE